MYYLEPISSVVEKTNTIHSDGSETKKSAAEVKALIGDEAFQTLKKAGIIVSNGFLIRKA
jgi:hypothetical protein